jgi:hypothetical protein
MLSGIFDKMRLTATTPPAEAPMITNLLTLPKNSRILIQSIHPPRFFAKDDTFLVT